LDGYLPVFIVKEKTVIIGLTGPVQNGKIQLAHVFQRCGWKFHDLNDVVYGRREKGSERYMMYQNLIPRCIDDEGVETSAFYQHMSAATYSYLLDQDMPHVGNVARQYCQAARSGSEKIVVSWEYLARISPTPELDHVLIFSSSRPVWFGRLNQRAAELGFDPLPSDDALARIIDVIDVWPETIRQQVYRRFDRKMVTEIDVGDEDWGASRLQEFLAAI
jgi:dephospho-CoA kinase